MKSLIRLILASVALSLFGLAPAAIAGGTQDRIQLHAELRGLDGLKGTVDYLEEGQRIRVKAFVQGTRVDQAQLVLEGVSYPFTMDPLSGTGYVVLDSRNGHRIPRMKAGDIAAVTSHGLTMLKGELVPVGVRSHT